VVTLFVRDTLLVVNCYLHNPVTRILLVMASLVLRLSEQNVVIVLFCFIFLT